MPDIGDLVLAIACCRARYPNFPNLSGFAFRVLRWRAKLSYALLKGRIRTADNADDADIKSRGQKSEVGDQKEIPHPLNPRNPRLKIPAAVVNDPRFTSLPPILAFYRYMADYNSNPVYGESEDSQPVKTPWYLFAVALQLRLNPRLTMAQAWNAQIGYTAWMNAAHLEAQGNKIDILTPELRDAFKQIGVPV